MVQSIPVAVAYGDGIGPEIMEAVLYVLEGAGAPLDLHRIEIGEKVYLSGHKVGITPETWEVIHKTKAFLKAPITTPQGGGFKSLNVTIRTSLGLYANVRPCISYAPYVKTKHPTMDVVIIRENEEDLYTGIEYRQTPHVCKSLKLISREGSERIVRYAFEFARKQGRKKVSCFTKDNIMKLSDGLFHKVFDEIAQEYTDIANEHWIVDIGAAKLADTPEIFDVIVLPNLYGDILSDVAAQISGSVGLAGSANIGSFGAMFEAIHGSAPRRAGQNMANPSGLLQAAVMMLLYLGETFVAERIQNAWLRTIEEGYHTYDIYQEGISREKLGTQEFARAVERFLGEKPKKLPAVSYQREEKVSTLHVGKDIPVARTLVGVDVFIYSKAPAPALLKKVQEIKASPLHLTLVSNRGARIWPDGQPETNCIEQWRLRFTHTSTNQPVSHADICSLLTLLSQLHYDVIATESLYLMEGQPAFS